MDKKSEDPACVTTPCFATQDMETCSNTICPFASRSFRQNEIVRIRLLDRRDRFAGDSFSESGAKGKLCHASAPYASRGASVLVTGPFARGRSGRHERVKICDTTCGARPLRCSAWAARIKQRAESILGIDILLAVARLCTEELFITAPSPLSLYLSLILKEKVTLSRIS